MFDYMIKILPNNRLLVRDNASKTSDTLKASEISGYFEKLLEEQLAAQEEQDRKIEEVKQQLRGDNDTKEE